jgi:hypothetical protein
VGMAENSLAIVVSRSVPDLNEEALRGDVMSYLARKSRAQRMMIAIWEQGGSLQIVREEPFTTYTGKTPPLRVVPKRAAGAS